MSRELNLLAKEFERTPVTVMRTNLNLYQTPINQAAAAFLRQVSIQARKEKTVSVTLVAVLKEPE
jgi:hypothetical protein